ncbi:hypothetical protein NQ318_001749 [Aromia moschata]|uniref:Uncharacterized protein n=1 Tax=Aromia moschata TaxID=1265417 RepID=A0AAV8XU69_9CUCU|nr:hypothetical protein NQ318_001749 [Aromia moschata]
MSGLTAKSKKGTVIHRTTSETLRLGDDTLSNHNHRVSVQGSSSRKKSQATSPSCSFQITGVSLTRCDIGDDSADDLDESHTDDISRVTDNETPSFSEDSRDNDDPAQQVSYNSAHTAVPQQQTAPKTEPEAKWKEKETRDLNLGRFKVVKIESVVPFSRGRWTCFDYLDHSDSTSKPSYVFCKKLGDEQSEILDMVKSHTCTGDSFVNPTYVDIGDRQKRIPNTSAFWETNCQESYLYSGAIIMPETTSLFPINLARPPKIKVRSTCPSTPSIPMVRPIRSTRPFFTTSPSFDSVIRASQGDKNNLINTCPAKIQVEVNNHDVCKEVVTQDFNKNDGFVEISAHSICFLHCYYRYKNRTCIGKMWVKNHLTHAVRLEVEELKIKINELVDRISYLEYENDLLRANVAPDVLANLGSSGGK